MLLRNSAALACTALLAATPPSFAGTRSAPEVAAYECARAIREQAGTGAYEVVKISDLPGRDRYRIWMNAHDDSVGAYCATRAGEVTETFVRETAWNSRWPTRPETPQPAAGLCNPTATR